jgi:ankyrin repeat protein
MNRETLLGVVVAVPGLLLAAVAVMVLAVGFRAFEPDPVLTLPEAAALRDNADVVLLVRQGADPNAPAAVRRAVLRSRTGVMTPLEAALTARHVETAGLLMDLGASVRDDNFERLFCLATRSRIDDLITLITARLPDHGAVDCAAPAGR